MANSADKTTLASSVDQARIYKEEGNEAFKNGSWQKSIDLYTKAIQNSHSDNKELSVFYKNRAAAYLKLNDYDNALIDCTATLEISPKDPKALFRRSQSYEGLEKYEEAYRDAIDLWKSDPSNKAIQPTMQRLHALVQQRADKNSQTLSKVTQMCDLVFDFTKPIDKRRTGINNLLVLARENVGAEMIYKEDVIKKIAIMTKTEKDEEIYLNAIRTIGEICNKNVERTKSVLRELGVPWFLQVLDSKSTDRVQAVQACLQTILNAFSGMDIKLDSKPNKEMIEKYSKEIDTLLTCLVYTITDRLISGLARDAVIELITRNVHHTALNWAERLVDIRGLTRLIEVCSELEEYKYESAMDITPSSRSIASCCLSRIYENMYYDQLRQKFAEQVEEWINDKLLTPDLESKVRATVAITSLLLGPLDVGNTIIAKEGIIQMILAMATTDDILQQKVACECIVAAASKKDKAKTLMGTGVDILKQLYRSKDDGIKVRALVGLCKLGSYGGMDASIRPFADGATKKLAEACRKFLIKPGHDKDIRKWAADGLAYLTLDAEVKEKLCDDPAAIRALIELSKTNDQSVIYGIVTTFVNVCNAYEKQEMLPEMIELAKFAKQHIPEEHELDDPDFINKRITVLCNEGITTALVMLSKTDSHNSRELICRVFNALCSLSELRGKVVQDGGVKCLLQLALDGTDKGKRHASQALARIGITINPEVAFSGQRNLDVIRPLLNNLHPDCTALENFESLMALCNLAQMSETVRKRILTEQGFSKIECFLMEEHQYLVRAACQCICNMCMSENVVKMHEGESDRVKFLALLCEDEDEETAKAASGALAILTSVSTICCEKIFDTVRWLDILHTLIANPSAEVQHRGLVVILNMINSGEETARKIMDTDVLELLMGLSKLPDDSRFKAKELAAHCLKAAEIYRIIAKSHDGPIPDIFEEASRILEDERRFEELD